MFVAKTLTYPEPVNEFNFVQLQEMIIRGPGAYPGAVYLEENGVKKILEKSSVEQRKMIAEKLLQNCENKIVHRHMIDNDIVLFNR